mmetsp:Transcript_113388/g.331410  ORF Transcript_113388/g.331410 Transcript_113388/m.331410 type:complete len:242 (+) Transcript_113388:209-934(+)
MPASALQAIAALAALAAITGAGCSSGGRGGWLPAPASRRQSGHHRPPRGALRPGDRPERASHPQVLPLLVSDVYGLAVGVPDAGVAGDAVGALAHPLGAHDGDLRLPCKHLAQLFVQCQDVLVDLWIRLLQMAEQVRGDHDDVGRRRGLLEATDREIKLGEEIRPGRVYIKAVVVVDGRHDEVGAHASDVLLQLPVHVLRQRSPEKGQRDVRLTYNWTGQGRMPGPVPEGHLAKESAECEE